MTTAEALKAIAEASAKIAEDLERLAGQPRHVGTSAAIRFAGEALAYHRAAAEIEKLAGRIGQ
jgi:hypothetical protein